MPLLIGEEELLPRLIISILIFGSAFEKEFVNQKDDENRSIEETLDRGWKALEHLPPEELKRVSEQELETYYKG